MNENVEKLARHIQTIRQRTVVSATLFVGFVAASSLSATRGARLEDVTTIASLGFIVGAFFLLPRDYRPGHLARAISDPDTEGMVGQLDGLQKAGMTLRAAFALGAIFTLAVLPRIL